MTAQQTVQATGIDLQAAISFWEKKRDLAKLEFGDSFEKYPSESKPTPDSVMMNFLTAEEAVAALQSALVAYNQMIQVEIGGDSMTLTNAIKLVGGAGRAEAMWRDAAKPRRNPYADMALDNDKTYPHPTMTLAAIQERATSAAKYAAQLRRAISAASATRMLVTLDPKLLEEAL